MEAIQPFLKMRKLVRKNKEFIKLAKEVGKMKDEDMTLCIL
jgi:hypothetical protein